MRLVVLVWPQYSYAGQSPRCVLPSCPGLKSSRVGLLVQTGGGRSNKVLHNTMRNCDSAIHFDDRGRELMAHLLLGALASALGPRKEQGEPAAEEEQAEDGDEEERAGYHLLVRSAPPIFRTVWRACLASPSALTAKLPIGTIPALRHACDLCGPACRNATLERKAAAADISPWQGDGVSDYAARSATHRQ